MKTKKNTFQKIQAAKAKFSANVEKYGEDNARMYLRAAIRNARRGAPVRPLSKAAMRKFSAYSALCKKYGERNVTRYPGDLTFRLRVHFVGYTANHSFAPSSFFLSLRNVVGYIVNGTEAYPPRGSLSSVAWSMPTAAGEREFKHKAGY